MSQQGMTIVSTEAADMGDFEYIEGKVVAGDYFQVSGDINAINDTIEFIPASGKTALLIEAKIIAPTQFSSSVVSNDQVNADLKVDGAKKDEAKIGSRGNSQAGGQTSATGKGFAGDGRFNVLGLSLVGDGVKKIEIENVQDSGSAFATMSGYVRDT